MKIKILNHEGKIFKKPEKENPWYNFFEEFEKYGFNIVRNRRELKYDILVCNGYRSKIELLIIKNLIKPKFTYLIIWEPIQSNPKMYSRKYLNYFDQIFVPSSDWLSGKNIQFFNWPQNTNVTPIQNFKNWQNRANKVVCIFANKYSVIKGEQYSLRRKFLNNAEFSKNIDLYGRNWNRSYLWRIFQIFKSLFKSNPKLISWQSLVKIKPDLQNYLGSTQSKIQSAGQYRISLVIENSANYLSEKLFDALISQTIVVFAGVELERIGLNKKIAIEVNDNLNSINNEILRLINLSVEEQYSIVSKQQVEFRKVLNEWNNNLVLSKLAKSICKFSSF